eukprot:14045806-Heterocapsa_arctica.AAC.1
MIQYYVKDETNELMDYVDDIFLFKEGYTEEEAISGLTNIRYKPRTSRARQAVIYLGITLVTHNAISLNKNNRGDDTVKVVNNIQ